MEIPAGKSARWGIARSPAMNFSFPRKIEVVPALALAILAALLMICPSRSDQATTPAPSPEYSITDIGPVPSIADDVSPDISPSGAVSLWSRTPSGAVHACIWQSGNSSDLGAPDGYPNSIPRGINDHGQVAGWVVSTQNPVDSQATTRAFLADGHDMRLLGTLGGKNSRATAINGKGLVVGVADTAGGFRHAFTFDGRKMADLGTLGTGIMSVAWAVNSDGVVAGAADTGKGARHAVIWKKGRIVDLGSLPGGRVSCANAIDDQGEVAGYAETPDGYHAFLWRGGAMQDLGTLKEEPSSACGMNNMGQVVGSSGMGHYLLHAFLWQNGHMADLNDAIAPGSGWVLTQAVAINDSGEIVCLAHKADHRVHALLLTPANLPAGK